MAYYYISLKSRAYTFVSKREALIFACDQLRYTHQRIRIYRDRECMDPVCTIEYMGFGKYNYYRGNSLSWEGQTPAEVDPVRGSVFNPFVKKR